MTDYINQILYYAIPSSITGWLISVYSPLQNILAKLPHKAVYALIKKIMSCPKCASANGCLIWMIINQDYVWILPTFAATALLASLIDNHLSNTKL